MADQDGRVAVITGGASGVGLGMATAFARAGLRIVILDIEQGAIDRAVEGLTGEGVEVNAIRTDVTDLAAMQAAAAQVRERHGAVHLLCNNAGVALERRYEEWTDIGWNWVHAVNVMGVVHAVQAFLPLLPEHGSAHILNTSSLAGLIGAAPGLGPYIATKWALVGLSQSLRSEFAAKGIGVSVLCPGQVRSNIRQALRNAPPAVRARLDEAPLGALPDYGAAAPALDPVLVGEMVLAGIAERRFYIVTDPSSTSHVLAEWDSARRDFEWATSYLGRAEHA